MFESNDSTFNPLLQVTQNKFFLVLSNKQVAITVCLFHSTSHPYCPVIEQK